MTTRLKSIVAAETGILADHIREGLKCDEAPHYRALDDGLLGLRCRRLVEAFADATEGDPNRFVDYVQEIAAARMAEGVGLQELQRALTLLEGRAWLMVIETAPIAQLVEDLEIVTGTIGKAKDALARRYLEQARRDEGRIDIAVPALFAGTDGVPEGGDN